jgi:hypothetical protein
VLPESKTVRGAAKIQNSVEVPKVACETTFDGLNAPILLSGAVTLLLATQSVKEHAAASVT